ncbi:MULTISPECIES: hypothetical protein [Aphanothece]|uniref:hypothetical protein n=1 Tax=Aphanothece TaxID=1121 RepID=UPI003984DBB3
MRSGDPTAIRRPPPFGRAQQGERLRLGLRNLYILPTRFGWLWLTTAAMLQAVGIQTQRNGPLLLSFLMLALLLLALHLTHFNLQGLELRCGEPKPGFAGQRLGYPLVTHSSCTREAIELRLTGGPAADPRRIPAGTASLMVPWTPERRGAQRPGRLVLSSRAPLGLFICWSRWDPPIPQVVYPARRAGPVALADQPAPSAVAERGSDADREGSAIWHDLRPHRPEDGHARLAWKVLAQGRGRLSKVLRDPAGEPQLLMPAAGVPLERALEHLSARIWQSSQRGEAYGLVLPHCRIPPGVGRRHRERCLVALARTP